MVVIWAASVTSNASASKLLATLGMRLPMRASQAALQRLTEEDQAQRSHSAELEAHIPTA